MINHNYMPAIKKAFLYSGSAGVAQLIMMVYTLVVARWLGPGEYSFFAATYSICTLTACVFNWGFDTWLLREGSVLEDFSPLVNSIFRIKFAIGLGWLVIMVAVVPLFRPTLFIPALLLIAGLDVLGDGLFNTGISTLNLTRQVKGMSAILFLSRGGRLISALALVFMNQRNVMGFVVGRAVATWIGLILALFLIRRHLGGEKWPSERLWKKSTIYGLSELMAIIYAQVDVTLLALLAEKNSVGIYSPAISLLNGLFILPNAIYNLLIPSLSRDIQNNWQRGRHRFLVAMIGLGALGIVLWAGLFYGGNWIAVALLGKGYQFSGQLLEILSPIIFIKSLEFGIAALLISAGWQKKRLLPQLFSAIIIIVLDLFIIPIYGPVGAAIVYLVCEIILLGGYLILAISWWRSHNNRPGQVEAAP